MLPEGIIPFIVLARRNTYAAGKTPTHASRPASHDLQFKEDPFLYIDTYLGGYHFIGQEAVWQKGINIWGMNYYGKMLVAKIPDGFSNFLKTVLMQTPSEAPYRGPAKYKLGDFDYQCSWKGSLNRFEGEEEISWNGNPIYQLIFHGGEIQD
ncbi:MAG: XRE family transcriptional regulator [Anaerolinea sp.]|nr:XRE family transcriptional regulator [Anaerolinea sp.]